VSTESRRHPLPEPVVVLDTFFGRLRGALFRRDWHRTTYVLTRTQAIHTWFMPGPVDVAFVDGEGRILRVLPALPPWRPAAWVRGAAHVIEAPVGTMAEWRPGDQVDLPHRRHRAGQALVEFALVLPILVTLIIGGVDLITLAGAVTLVAQSAQDAVATWVADPHNNGNGQGTLQQAAQDACRTVAQNLSNGTGLGLSVTGTVVTIDAGQGPPYVFTLPSCDQAGGSGQPTAQGAGQANGRVPGTVTVTVQAPFHFIVPLPRVLTSPSSITKSATG
jgi:Flp pilus assembly protein TadG/uncharacterized membrane protein (UPF0127 family)